MKSAKNGIILFDFMGEFYRSMKPSNTTKKTGMGYSAAYPTGAERCLFQSFGFLVSSFGLVGIKAAKNAKVAKRFGF